MKRWERVTWTTNSLRLHAYAHRMFKRRGYGRVDKSRRGLYYTVHGDTFTWYEWKAPGGLFTSMRVGFWELYQRAHEEDAFRDAYNEAGA
jgi:hypothetical protein